MPPRTQCPNGRRCKNYDAHVMSGPEGDGCMGPCARGIKDNPELCPHRDDDCIGICLGKCARDGPDGEDGPWAHGWETRVSDPMAGALARILWLEERVEQLQQRIDASIEFMEQSEAPFYKGLQALKGEQS